MNEGKKLSDWLDENNKNAYDLAQELGVTPQSVYNQLKRERLSDSFKNRLELRGINYKGNETAKPSHLSYDELKIKYDLVIEEVRIMRSDVRMLKDFVSMLNQEVQRLQQQH